MLVQTSFAVGTGERELYAFSFCTFIGTFSDWQSISYRKEIDLSRTRLHRFSGTSSKYFAPLNRRIGYRSLIYSFLHSSLHLLFWSFDLAAILRREANPLYNQLFWVGNAHFFTLPNESSFPHSTSTKWILPLGTNCQPRIEIWLHSKSELLFESMRKCCIRIPLEILLILDPKISKIEPEMAQLALFCL